MCVRVRVFVCLLCVMCVCGGGGGRGTVHGLPPCIQALAQVRDREREREREIESARVCVCVGEQSMCRQWKSARARATRPGVRANV